MWIEGDDLMKKKISLLVAGLKETANLLMKTMA